MDGTCCPAATASRTSCGCGTSSMSSWRRRSCSAGGTHWRHSLDNMSDAYFLKAHWWLRMQMCPVCVIPSYSGMTCVMRKNGNTLVPLCICLRAMRTSVVRSPVTATAWDTRAPRLVACTGGSRVYLWSPAGASCVHVPLPDFDVHGAVFSAAASQQPIMLLTSKDAYCCAYMTTPDG